MVVKARAETRSGLRICTKCQAHPPLLRVPYLVTRIPDTVEHEEIVLPEEPPCFLMVVDVPSLELNKPESLVISKFRAFSPRLLAHEQHLLYYYMQQVEEVVAPSLLTEGKVYQKAQHLGMGK